jgi:hypothetical protein
VVRLTLAGTRNGVDLLLDVERRGGDDQVARVGLVLAAPDELRIEVPVAPLVGEPHRSLRPLVEHRLVLRRRDVRPRRVAVYS